MSWGDELLHKCSTTPGSPENHLAHAEAQSEINRDSKIGLLVVQICTPAGDGQTAYDVLRPTTYSTIPRSFRDYCVLNREML